MKNYVLAITLIILAGCASFPEAYNKLGLPEEDLALVTGSYKPGFFYTDYAVYFNRVYDESGNQVIGNPDPKSWNHARLERVRLQPGKYLFHTICDSGNAYAFPSIALSVKANKTYLLTCEKTMKKNGFFGINVIDKIGLSVKEIDSHNKSSNSDAEGAGS
jgi:hypothetical protein